VSVIKDRAIEIKEYIDETGNSPYEKWARRLRDQRAIGKIAARLSRIKTGGNFGDSKSIGDGVSELRIPYGPGYRVYFGREGETVIILLCGGDKSTQRQDIGRAKAYWQEHTSGD